MSRDVDADTAAQLLGTLSGNPIDVCVIDVKPHPAQATHNPGCWAVRFEVSYDDHKRTFWRWYTVRTLSANKTYVRTTSTDKPRSEDIIRQFWSDTFADLHGFNFDKVAP